MHLLCVLWDRHSVASWWSSIPWETTLTCYKEREEMTGSISWYFSSLFHGLFTCLCNNDIKSWFRASLRSLFFHNKRILAIILSCHEDLDSDGRTAMSGGSIGGHKQTNNPNGVTKDRISLSLSFPLFHPASSKSWSYSICFFTPWPSRSESRADPVKLMMRDIIVNNGQGINISENSGELYHEEFPRVGMMTNGSEIPLFISLGKIMNPNSIIFND